MAMDWVPMSFYRSGITMSAGTTAFVILYPLPPYAVDDTELVFEDNDDIGLFLERVAGEIRVVWSQGAGTGVFTWRLMPLGADYDTPAALLPFSGANWSNTTEWANLRWWKDMRVVPGDVGAAELIDHPWWTTVDIHPRQLLGARRNLYPVLALDNQTTVEVVVAHSLRALWK